MKRIFSLLAIALLLAGCSGEEADNNPDQPMDQNPDPGFNSFSLRYFYPNADQLEFIDFDKNEIVWEFDFDNQEIDVVVLPTAESVFLSSGTYSYTLEDNPCNFGENRYIYPDGRKMGLMILDQIDEGFITITEECISGPVYTFQRN